MCVCASVCVCRCIERDRDRQGGRDKGPPSHRHSTEIDAHRLQVIFPNLIRPSKLDYRYMTPSRSGSLQGDTPISGPGSQSRGLKAYGVASINKMLKNIGLIAKYRSLLQKRPIF